MEKRRIRSCLCVFGRNYKILKSVFLRQANCSAYEIAKMIDNGYLISSKSQDDDELLIITQKGKDLI